MNLVKIYDFQTQKGSNIILWLDFYVTLVKCILRNKTWVTENATNTDENPFDMLELNATIINLLLDMVCSFK